MRVALPVQLSANDDRPQIAADKEPANPRGQLNHSQTLRGSGMSGQAPRTLISTFKEE